MPTNQDIQNYRDYAYLMAQQYGVPANLFDWMLQTESGYNPNAKNPNSSASGIAQFTKGTAAYYNVDVFDPYDSIQKAAQYMSDLHAQNGGSWIKAVNSYGTTMDAPGVINPGREQKALNALALDGSNVIPVMGDGQKIVTDSAPGITVSYPADTTDTAGNGGSADKSAGYGGLFDKIMSSGAGIVLMLLGIVLIAIALLNNQDVKNGFQVIVSKGARLIQS